MRLWPRPPGRGGGGVWVLILAFAGWAAGALGTGQQNDDPAGSLPNLDIDLDSFYYERALTPPSESTLLASTIDGSLVALNQQSGEVIWKLDEEPVVKSPYDAGKPVVPAFLPDPKDGSIYVIGGGLKDALKKLPFTIPQLVEASPCKSSDGILYTGKKVDQWFSVDRYTGKKQGSVSFQGCVAPTLADAAPSGGSGGSGSGSGSDQCPNLKPSNFLIGRTEYTIHMYDGRGSKGGKSWNMSFYDYASCVVEQDVGVDYEFTHFADSSTGSLVTLDRRSGLVQWERTLGSPIVALYRLQGGRDGVLNVPLTSVSKETLNNLMDQFNAPDVRNERIGETKLFPTLFVGETDNGLYAMPSLVDEQTLTISPGAKDGGQPLLEGPQNIDQLPLSDEVNVNSADTAVVKEDPLSAGIPLAGDDAGAKGKSSVLLFGYYQIPEHSNIHLNPAVTYQQQQQQQQLQLTAATSTTGQTKFILNKGQPVRFIPALFPGPGGDTPALPHPHQQQYPRDPAYPQHYPHDPAYPYSPRRPGVAAQDAATQMNHASPSYDEALIVRGLDQLRQLNTTFIFSTELARFAGELLPLAKEAFVALENKELKAIVILLVVAIAVLWKMMKSHFDPASGYYSGMARFSNSLGGSSNHSNGSANGSKYAATAQAVEMADGTIRVGNIALDPSQILGKGCEGTFVYKGRFDNRDVAVKRVLAACFSIADREVDLLRESDEHPNVVRYFCMEQDKQFRYIALEFCAATLHDYIDGKYVNPSLDALTILRQATLGLQHLHSLDIVHRDVKPHNVLISTPGAKGDVRAMISDFGLCKKLKVGRMSFSRRSGVAGTEGWIAPEMMLGHKSNTCAVDIFSLGCVYYYVLTRGHHPFGESFRRQANILAGEFNLESSPLEGDVTARSLIAKMLAADQGARPTTRAVLRHPLFWREERVLNFLQDVSDRVDKEDYDSAILMSLERNKSEIVRQNWHDWLDDVVREDLRRHRSYNGKKVRDLLRAMRNKKHHYNELHPLAKAAYGRVPDQFAAYWTRRFPRLLTHVWQAMHCIKNEPGFGKYFDKDYDFLQTAYPPQMSFVPDPLRHASLTNSPNKAKRINLFEPHFLDEAAEEEGEGEEGVDVNVPSCTSSVVSQWEQRAEDSGRVSLSALPSAVVQEEDVADPAVVSVVDDDDDDDSNYSQDFHKDADEHRDAADDDGKAFAVPPAQDPAGPRDSPARGRRNPVQLDSQARQRYLRAMAEKKEANRPTWAETVQNISADDKVAAASSSSADGRVSPAQAPAEDCDTVHRDKENCDPGPATSAPSGDISVGDASNGDAQLEGPSVAAGERDTGVVNDGAGTSAKSEEEEKEEPQNGPKWILPPASPKKKKKGKAKNKPKKT